MNDTLRCPTCETETLALWLRSWNTSTFEPQKIYMCQQCHGTWETLDPEGDFSVANSMEAHKFVLNWRLEEVRERWERLGLDLQMLPKIHFP